MVLPSSIVNSKILQRRVLLRLRNLSSYGVIFFTNSPVCLQRLIAFFLNAIEHLFDIYLQIYGVYLLNANETCLLVKSDDYSYFYFDVVTPQCVSR